VVFKFNYELTSQRGNNNNCKQGDDLMGILSGLFKRGDDPAQTSNEDQRNREEAELDAKLKSVRFFPGSKEEYELLCGYSVVIIDTHLRDMGVLFGKVNNESDYELYGSFDLKKMLIEQGIEAIINCNYSLGGNNLVSYHRKYGLPITKAKIKT
jgi:hypothetical protein